MAYISATNIGFINTDASYDETQFDVDWLSDDDLADLWLEFSIENNILLSVNINLFPYHNRFIEARYVETSLDCETHETEFDYTLNLHEFALDWFVECQDIGIIQYLESVEVWKED